MDILSPRFLTHFLKKKKLSTSVQKLLQTNEMSVVDAARTKISYTKVMCGYNAKTNLVSESNLTQSDATTFCLD